MVEEGTYIDEVEYLGPDTKDGREVGRYRVSYDQSSWFRSEIQEDLGIQIKNLKSDVQTFEIEVVISAERPLPLKIDMKKQFDLTVTPAESRDQSAKSISFSFDISTTGHFILDNPPIIPENYMKQYQDLFN